MNKQSFFQIFLMALHKKVHIVTVFVIFMFNSQTIFAQVKIDPQWYGTYQLYDSYSGPWGKLDFLVINATGVTYGGVPVTDLAAGINPTSIKFRTKDAIVETYGFYDDSKATVDVLNHPAQPKSAGGTSKYILGKRASGQSGFIDMIGISVFSLVEPKVYGTYQLYDSYTGPWNKLDLLVISTEGVSYSGKPVNQLTAGVNPNSLKFRTSDAIVETYGFYDDTKSTIDVQNHPAQPKPMGTGKYILGKRASGQSGFIDMIGAFVR